MHSHDYMMHATEQPPLIIEIAPSLSALPTQRAFRMRALTTSKLHVFVHSRIELLEASMAHCAVPLC